MTNPSDRVSIRQYIGLFQGYAAKLVLEVFGAGGAIWGFSEVCGFRTMEIESIEFWRKMALTTAALFGVRWLRQLLRAATLLQETQKPNTTNAAATPLGRSSLILETPQKDNSFLDELRERSPRGIQLSSVLFGDERDEEEALLSPESCDESTALTMCSRSPPP